MFGSNAATTNVFATEDAENPGNQSKLEFHVADGKRGKTRPSESRLVLVLLIGYQNCSVVSVIPITFRPSMKTALSKSETSFVTSSSMFLLSESSLSSSQEKRDFSP